MSDTAFHLLVLGGGSGGVACARRASSHGAKVAIVEGNKWGGTCVNVGCVPKKIMWWASTLKEMVQEASPHYGFNIAGQTINCNWAHLKMRRDANITRLNGIYEGNLNNSGVQMFNAYASFMEPPSPGEPIRIALSNGVNVEAWNVLIAVGGEPVKLGVPGDEHVANSDDFFGFEQQPRKVAVFGAGYIAVELSQVLAGLGSETHLFCRTDMVLRKFDPILGKSVLESFKHQGGHFHPNSQAEKIELGPDGTKIVYTKAGEKIEGFDCVLSCVGRAPLLGPLKIANLGGQLKLTKSNHIEVDDYQNTSIPHIYALGDVCGKVELTPMAIAAGRRLADRLFLRGYEDAKADYDLVPSVIFSHPPCASVGLSEQQAIDTYGSDDVLVYNNVCVNLFYNVFDVDPSSKPRSRVKLICRKSEDEKVIGLHMFGMGAEEVIQGFAVAIKMGARKADFDRTVAVHPSFAEEIVTCHPWSLPHENNNLKRSAQFICPTGEVETTTHD